MVFKIIFFSLLLLSCSVVQFGHQLNHSVDASWKNPKYSYFKPSKILILAILNDPNDRNVFEENLNKEFNQRGITSYSSHKKYNQHFVISLKSDNELKLFDEKLTTDGFDAIFVSTIKGVEKQPDYKKDYYKIYHDWYRFNRFYNHNPDAFIFPNYYNVYKYYNLESSLYIVNGKNDKTIVWAGVIKIIDPLKINEVIQHHSKTILKELENQQIIPKKST